MILMKALPGNSGRAFSRPVVVIGDDAATVKQRDG
jgi:hypothetical protein